VRVITEKQLQQRAVPHPYDTNPGYEARIHSFHFSRDQKLVAGYWEAPQGWFLANIDAQTEVNFVIEGEIELVMGEKSVIARKGDCFVVEPGDQLKWIVRKPIRTKETATIGRRALRPRVL
jgi:uncharacterized cupin superfamily protein